MVFPLAPDHRCCVVNRGVRTILVACGVIAWVTALGLGGHWLFRHEVGPGAIWKSPTDWPEESALARHPERFTLILFLHPYCPCSWTSVDSLRTILEQTGGQCDPIVAFVAPPGAEVHWVESDLWQRARRMSAVQVVVDQEGHEARRFGARTSGQTLLYDAAGRLRFDGGITGGRSHPGPNPGQRAIVRVLQGKSTERRHAPVFGCRLIEEPEAVVCREGIRCDP